MDSLLSFFATIRWQDVFDIVLISFILFRLYVLFRGTNVFRVLIGIGLLWFFQRMAVSLGFVVTSWAIQGVTTFAALIIIVVFRNEIRSVLQAKNLKAILWGSVNKSHNTPLDVIVESVYELARRKMGALIVFPGRENLEEVIHSGIPWHGLTSKEMILSVFWHDNPVHDGAVVIQGDRITQVGVVLPVSRNGDFPSHYGTRHRAAAGLAEATDALVTMVSEEKGHVVTAKASRLHVVQDKEEFHRILCDHLDFPSDKGRSLRRERVRLVATAVISLLFIAGVWFGFTRGLDTLITLEVPVDYINRRPDMEILDTSVNMVHVRVSGSEALIKSIRPEQVRLRIDLSNAVSGVNTFDIIGENITLPPGVFLNGIQPSTVRASLDVIIEKVLPVQIEWVGSLPEQLVLVKARPDPESVKLIGGSTILKSMSTVYTEKIPLDQIKESGSKTVNLAVNPASLKVAPDSKGKIRIDYEVKGRFPVVE